MASTGSRERYVPALGRDALTALYDPLIRRTTRERAFKERLLDQAALAPGQRVLDVGCGTGTLTVWAKQREPGIEISGIDGDAAVLRRAERQAAEAGLAVGFRRALGDDPPFGGAPFRRRLTSPVFPPPPRARQERS